MRVKSQIYVSNHDQKPCLLLNFDVNKTLVLKDSSKGMNGDEMLISILADEAVDRWDDTHDPMSYKDYVHTILLPGDKSNQALKKQREEVIRHFLEWLEEKRHPTRERVLALRDRIKEKFTDPHTQQIKFAVFGSFFALLKKLRENNIRFVLILRTFGNDLKDVAEEVSNHPSGVKFTRWGKFSHKQLQLEESESIVKAKKIFKTFLNSQEHFAIQDNWKEWNSDQERARSGKPFIYDASGRWHDICNLSIFFDDNFSAEEERDILNPIEIAETAVSSKELKDRLLFKVNPVQAILEDDYYIKLVNQSLSKHGYEAII